MKQRNEDEGVKSFTIGPTQIKMDMVKKRPDSELDELWSAISAILSRNEVSESAIEEINYNYTTIVNQFVEYFETINNYVTTFQGNTLTVGYGLDVTETTNANGSTNYEVVVDPTEIFNICV